MAWQVLSGCQEGGLGAAQATAGRTGNTLKGEPFLGTSRGRLSAPPGRCPAAEPLSARLRRARARQPGRAPPQEAAGAAGTARGACGRSSSLPYRGMERTETPGAQPAGCSRGRHSAPSRPRRLRGHGAPAAGETPQGTGPPPRGTGPLPPGQAARRPAPPIPRGARRRGGPERAGTARGEHSPGRALPAASRTRRRPPRLTAPWGGAWPRMRRQLGRARAGHVPGRMRGVVPKRMRRRSDRQTARGRSSERRRAWRPLSRRCHARPRGGAG